MDVQHGLLSKVILDGEISFAVNSRITPEFFTDQAYQRVYSFLLKHWRDYGSAADEKVVQRAFPTYEWLPSPQPLQYYIDQLRQRRKKVILTDALGAAAGLLHDKDNPAAVDGMEDTIREALMKVRLETAPTMDEDFTGMSADIEQMLDNRMLDPGFLRGISTGFRGIDVVTGGFQPEQFIVLLGLPKAFKSSTLLYMAKECHRQGRIPLFLGFEMTNVEQEDRLLSMFSGVGLTKIMNGTLTFKERNQVLSPFRQLQSMRPFLLSSDTASAMTVSGIQAKVQEYQPDVVFIDGAYMMQSELPKVEPGSAAALTDIARALKRLAQAQRIPIVVTTQASLFRSKQGLNLGSAMYTQAWGQSADVMLGVERLDQNGDESGEAIVKFKVIVSRSGPRVETHLVWDWTKGQVIEMDPSFRPRSDDDEDGD